MDTLGWGCYDSDIDTMFTTIISLIVTYKVYLESLAIFNITAYTLEDVTEHWLIQINTLTC